MKTYLTHPLTALIAGGLLIGIGIDFHKFFVGLPGVACAIYGLGRGFVWLLHNVD